MTFDFTYASEHGYLNDPYRGVMFAENFLQTNPSDAGLTPERRPAHRDSETFYAGYTRFIGPLNGSVDAGYRFFHDTSEIFGQTMQLAWHQKIGRHWVISPEFRYYYQTAANYYYVLVPNLDSPPAYYSSDYRLSQMQTIDGGLSVMCRIAKFVAVDLRYDRYVMQGLDGSTSQSAYPSANIISAGVRIYF